ncbi:MAG: flagellin [Patescibacteria group bacterium]
MGLRIQNNIAAMNAHKQLSSADAGMTKSLERLSSGYRINKAADDAAGLSISQQFRADIASFKVASRNTAEAGSLLQVAEGAMDQIGNMLTRLKELATQAASANAGSNLDKIESEKAKLVSEIDRIANSTEYAGSKLLDGTFGTASASWDNEDATSNVSLDTVNGNKYAYTDAGTNTSTVSFQFSSSVSKLTAQTYTLSTLAAGGALSSTVGSVKITGGTDGAVYAGYLDATTNSLKFDTIGLTIDGATSALTAATVDGDSFVVTDVGYDAMTISSSTATGTWTITDDGSGVKLTNGTDSQTISGTASGPKTLDFDQLGIKLTLNSNYATTDLNAMEFVVSNSGSSTFQVGAYNTANDKIAISVGNVTTSSTGLNLSGIDLSTSAGAQSALTTINTAIDTLAGRRGEIGAAQNRLGYAAANLSTTIENVQAAESVIRDVDMALEMTNFTKNQILMQASTSMLAQANMAPQGILSLFQG